MYQNIKVLNRTFIEPDTILLELFLNFSNNKLSGEIYNEENVPLKELEEKCYDVLDKLFTTENYTRITNQTSEEITKAANEQEELDPIDNDTLRQDMRLDSFTFFEDAVILSYLAPTIFEENEISVQIDFNFTIEDIAIDI